jgi:CBS domain containing-hemolysin-like protein
MTTALGWVALVALIAANAFFVAAEFSFTSVDRNRVRQLEREGDRRARALHKATAELSFQLSAVQLGITVCSLLLGFVAEPVIADALEPVLTGIGLSHRVVEPTAVIAALVLATIAQMMVGELVPQNLAIAAPLEVGRAVVRPQRAFTKVARPVVALFDGAANAIVRGLGIEPQQELRGARSPVEFRAMIATSEREGTLDTATAQLLSRGLLFGDKTAGDVMTPRVQVVAVRADDTVADLLALAKRSGLSRFPVQRRDLDDVAGVAHAGDALGVPRARRTAVPVGGLMVEPERVPESLDCDALLRRLSRARSQLAVVVDEYGGTAGVVTLEDLVEELVGQVRDEYDIAERPEAHRSGEGFELSGQLHKDEMGDLLGVASPQGPFDTVAGLLMERLGRLPETGDGIEYHGWRLQVTAMDGRRVDRVSAEPVRHDE